MTVDAKRPRAYWRADLWGLEALTQTKVRTENLILEEVRRLRVQRVPWSAIAGALRESRDAVYQRYHRKGRIP